MSEAICDDKFVELTYKVTDTQSGQVLSAVEFPIAYVHGRNQLLLEAVQEQLEGKRAGETIDVPVDCNKLYGPRDEALVFTDRIENAASNQDAVLSLELEDGLIGLDLIGDHAVVGQLRGLAERILIDERFNQVEPIEERFPDVEPRFRWQSSELLRAADVRHGA